jgi:hypothetical protein
MRCEILLFSHAQNDGARHPIDCQSAHLSSNRKRLCDTRPPKIT